MSQEEGRMAMSELRAQIVNLLQDAWELGYECGAKDVSSARPVTLDAMTDTELAEHGLVRLPVDADGVRIDQGDIVEFCDKPDGEQMPVVDASYSYGMGNWVVTVKRDVGVSVFSTVILRHVAAAPAPDTPRRWRTLWTR